MSIVSNNLLPTSEELITQKKIVTGIQAKCPRHRRMICFMNEFVTYKESECYKLG